MARSPRKNTHASSNHHSEVADTVVAFRAKQAAKRAQQEKLNKELAFRRAQVQLATRFPQLAELDSDSLVFQVAIKMLEHYVGLEVNKGRTWAAYQEARKDLNVVTRQRPKDREVELWHGRQVADMALSWAYELLKKQQSDTSEDEMIAA